MKRKEKEFLVTEKVLYLEKYIVKASSKLEAKEKVKCQSNDTNFFDMEALRHSSMKVEEVTDETN